MIRRTALLFSIAIVAALFIACGSSHNSLSPQQPPLPDGNYVFHLSGTDYYSATNISSPYFAVGAFTISNGAITQGEEDFSDYTHVYPGLQLVASESGFARTGDGNLQIFLNTGNNNIGSVGVQTLNATLMTATSARLTEFDSFANGTGALEPQSSTAEPSGGYAFFSAGLDQSAFPLGVGGIINVDGPGTISGSGSIFDLNDAQNTVSGVGIQAAQLISSGTVLNATGNPTPDSFGRVLITLNPVNPSIPPMVFAGYIVDSTTIRLVETADGLLGTTGGTALSQGANTGGFSASSISGSTYVIGAQGGDAVGDLQFASALTFNADSSMAGTVSFNDLAIQVAAGAIESGAYSVDTNPGTGRVTVSNLAGTDPNSGNTYGPATLQLYLDGNGNAFALSLDQSDVTAGAAFEQTAVPILSGSFAVSSNGLTPVLNQTTGITTLYPWGAVGLVSITTGGVGTGFTDLNVLTVGQTSGVGFNALSGGSNGVLTAKIAGLGYISTANTYTYYVIDGNHALGIETDANQLSALYGETSTQ